MKPVHEMSAAEVLAEAQRREANRRAGRPLDAPALVEPRTATELEADEARDEKRVVQACDKQLRALGFVVWNLSQPRHAKYLSPGIADRLYTHPARGVALWWEAKSATGRQRPDQRYFQEHMDACGWPYLVGTDQVVYDWLVAQGIAAEVEGGLLVPLPYRSPNTRSA